MLKAKWNQLLRMLIIVSMIAIQFMSMPLAGRALAAVGDTSVSISPAARTVTAGGTFTVDVAVAPSVAIAGAQFNLSYDPSVLAVTSVSEGNLLKQGGATTYFQPGEIDNATGSLSNVAGATTSHGSEVTGPGIFATVTFQAKAAGTTALTLSEVVASTKEGAAVPVQLTNGSVTVQGGATAVPVTGVTLNKTSLALSVGANETLTATVAPDNATNKSVTWSSSNEPVATVDQTGKVTAVSPGAAIITVTTADGSKTATCSVTVQAAVPGASVGVSPAARTVTAGGTFTVDVAVAPSVAIAGAQFNLGYDPSVLAVTSVTEGNLLKQGGATTYFQPGEIDNATGNLTNVIGATTSHGAEVTGPGIFATITFQAKAAGTSALTLSEVVASTKEGAAVPVQLTNGSVTVQSGTTTVSVRSITVSGAGGAIAVQSGSTLQMHATVLPANATNRSVTWSVINVTGTAAIDANGVITGGAAGSVTVRAAARDSSGVHGDKSITVSQASPVLTTIAAGKITGQTAGATVYLSAVPVTAYDQYGGSMTIPAPSWAIADAGGTGATLAGAGLTLPHAGSCALTASVTVGGVTRTAQLYVNVSDATVAAAASNNITASNSNLVVADSSTPVTVNIGATASNTTVDVSNMVQASLPGDTTTTTRPLPAMNINAQVQFQGQPAVRVQVSIPQNTTITAQDPNWNGVIQAPSVVDPATLPVSALPDNATKNSAKVVAVGFGDVSLSFDQPVKIVIPGGYSSNVAVGYIRNNAFTPINSRLTTDSGSTLTASAPDGYYVDGTNINIWTLHFTSFVAVPVVASTSTSTGGGGGGGGVTAAVVQTSGATAITDTTATLAGSITNSGGADITAYGFLWSTDQNSLDQKQQAGTDNHSGTFQVTLSGLKPETTYYYKAYATSSQGTIQGALKQFTTAKAGTRQPQPPTQPAEGTTFTDVSGSYWAQQAIYQLNTMGILSGYPDGSFKPDGDITRAEFAVMLVKALGLKPSTETQVQFQDVPATSWCYASVAAAAQAGLIKGLGDGLFAPNTPVTREQMAVMIVNALESAGYTTSDDAQSLDKFGDRGSIDAWALPGMAKAVNAGVVHGMTTGTIAPLEHAARAQAAAMVQALLRLTGKTQH